MGFKRVKKKWGEEVWVCNEPMYCMKFLNLKSGYQCSLHAHAIKTETFSVLKGQCTLEVEHMGKLEKMTLYPGTSFTILPGTYHRFSNSRHRPMCIIIETSTHHEDSDVIRKEDSRRVK